jgi:[calcium/calmodulin-dependent protein kinase] kinase
LTKGGADPLLPRDENISALIEPPTEEELNNAITGNMGSLLVVVSIEIIIQKATINTTLQMKAVKKFKKLLVKKRPELMEGIFGRASRFVQPPLSMSKLGPGRSHSNDIDDRKPVEAALASEGVHRKIPITDDLERLPEQMDMAEPSRPTRWAEKLGLKTPKTLEKPATPTPEPRQETGKGQAHNPLEDTLILGIGAGGDEDSPLEPGEFSQVSESPGAVDINVYEKAYQEEIDRLTREKGDRKPTLYLTRRVENNKEIRSNEHITDFFRSSGTIRSNLGFRNLVEQAKANVSEEEKTADAAAIATTSSSMEEDGKT